MEQNLSHRKFLIALRVLLIMIVGLMALGAAVRVNNAGLSCPDWPLCYGQVIPDYHPVVWFEFVHRAYAGLVGLFFVGCAIYSWRSKLPWTVKTAAAIGLLFLVSQILMGALTVLLLVKAVVVTMHLMLATCFFLSTFVMHELIRFPKRPAGPEDFKVRRQTKTAAAKLVPFAFILSFAILLQIALGGLVASTYAGSVCVDWPLCNGQWVPTWTGSIGLQIIHRFVAYTLALIIVAFAITMFVKRRARWSSKSLVRVAGAMGVVVLTQVGIGVANLIMFIPPSLAVLHQSVAILLLTLAVHLIFVSRRAL